MVRTSRRDLLSAGAMTALAGVAAVTLATPDAHAIGVLPAADAELIALHDRFMALQNRITAINAGDEDPTDDEVSSVISYQTRLLHGMGLLSPTTPEGHRARARAFVAW